MLRLAGMILSALVLLTILSLTAVAVDLQADYFNSVKSHFNLNSDEVSQISNSGIVDEELPVVFFIAGQANVDPVKIVNTRLEGESWMEVCDHFSVKATDFYMIVADQVGSKVYGPVFEKYSTTPQRNWKNIELTDTEIINLVNLKLMYSLHDYSVYEIMAMRDFGKSFPRINQQVELAKKEMNEKQNKTLEAR